MISVIGPEDTEEFRAAMELSQRIVAAWPAILTDDQQDIRIVAAAKCYGQRVEDIDIIVFAQLGNGYTLSAGQAGAGDVQVLSFCLAIEVKGHPPERVRIIGNQVEVQYRDKWSNVSEQSHLQQVSLRRYLEKHAIVPPYVVNLIWLQNYPENLLPQIQHNIIGGDASWDIFLQRVRYLQAVRANRLGVLELRALADHQLGFLLQAAEVFTRRLLPSRLDRKKMEQVSERLLSRQQYSGKLGEQLLIFRGRGGTGKTVSLLRLANDLYQDQYARVLILTYNKALVSDIRRLLALMNIRAGVAERSILVQTVHSFMYQLLHGLGIIPEHCSDFLMRYDNYKAEALELMGAIEPHDVAKLTEQSHDVFSWDYILVDEAQDWPKDERDILFSVYDYRQFVLADGIDQLVRSGSRTDWRENIVRKHTQVVTLKKSLRLKAGLCQFAQTFAQHMGLEGWNIEPNLDVHGGRILVVEGPYSKSRAIHDEILHRNISDGNALVDMLFCVPPRLVTQEDSGVTYSLVGKKFMEWGFNVWDGATSDIRDSYPTDLEQLRIVQYDSCRGLEGWVVVNFEFDQLYDYKLSTYEPTDQERSDLYFNQEKAAIEHATRWLMIPLTRAIDTLVIQITSADHVVGQALRSTVAECSDFAEWKKV